MEHGQPDQGPAADWDEVLPALLAAAEAAVTAPCERLPDAAVLDTLLTLESVTARLAAVRLALVAEVDTRGLAAAAGATGPGMLLRERLRMRPGDAHADVRLSRALTRSPALRDALAAGKVSAEQARSIHRVLRGLPKSTPPTVVAEVTGTLLAEAARFDPTDLARLGRRILAHLDPDGPAPDRAERRGRLRRELSWNARDDGTVKLWGQLDADSAATLIAALDPLSAPHPADQHGPDPRTPAQRRADALLQLTRHALDSGTLPVTGGQKPHVTVTVSLDTLRDSLGTALLDPTGPISPHTARRLACDAQIIPVLLGTHAEPLDVGRASRTIPTPIRRALTARDRGCAFPSCDRPPTWCDGHHIQHWANGGPTSLSNLVLLCGHHHRRIHHAGWHVRINTHGTPEFHPPGPTPHNSPLWCNKPRW
jgi:Domain of unknown function (DUF222)/HNH endonuclease